MTGTGIELLPMKTVIKFYVEPKHYKSGAYNLFCLDCNWCNEQYDKLYLQEGYLNPDRNYVPGGAKKLASPQNEGEREATLKDILDVLKLHDCHRTNLGVHVRCGKYGLKFETYEEEIHFLQQELLKAKDVLEDYLRQEDYEAEIHLYLFDREGMQEL